MTINSANTIFKAFLNNQICQAGKLVFTLKYVALSKHVIKQKIFNVFCYLKVLIHRFFFYTKAEILKKI